LSVRPGCYVPAVPRTLDTIRAAYDDAADRYNALVKSTTTHPLDQGLLDAFAELAGTGPIADLRRGRPDGPGTR
jgi:hypothetical protein